MAAAAPASAESPAGALYQVNCGFVDGSELTTITSNEHRAMAAAANCLVAGAHTVMVSQ